VRATCRKGVGIRRAGAFLAKITGVIAVGCETHECTEIGCADGWSLTLVEADGAPAAHTLEALVDGAEFVCPQVSLGARHVTCGASVTLELVDEVTCVEHETNGGISQICTPTGRFEEILAVSGTPKTVLVTLRDAGGEERQETFVPEYESSQPNGPDCSPTCRQAVDRWELP
jgi:hypothetical protein